MANIMSQQKFISFEGSDEYVHSESCLSFIFNQVVVVVIGIFLLLFHAAKPYSKDL